MVASIQKIHEEVVGIIVRLKENYRNLKYHEARKGKKKEQI